MQDLEYTPACVPLCIFTSVVTREYSTALAVAWDQADGHQDCMQHGHLVSRCWGEPVCLISIYLISTLGNLTNMWVKYLHVVHASICTVPSSRRYSPYFGPPCSCPKHNLQFKFHRSWLVKWKLKTERHLGWDEGPGWETSWEPAALL